MFLVVHHMFMHITRFNLKSTSKIWKTCLFSNSFKSLNLGYHYPHIFTRVYFSIQMSCLINWIRVYHVHTHIKFNMQIDWWHIRWYDMNVGHHSIKDQFHWTRWMPQTFPSCNIASKLRSRVDKSMLIHVIFTRKQSHVLYLRLYLGPKSYNFLWSMYIHS